MPFLVSALLLLPACRPGAQAPLPDDLRIEVSGASPIDASRLGSLPPDWDGDGKRAWKLSRLLGPAAEGARSIEVESDDGSTLFRAEDLAAEHRTLVLLLNRRGEVLLTTVPSEGFPGFQGSGNHHGGSTGPKLHGVTRLTLTRS